MYSENQLNKKAVDAVQAGLNAGSVWTYLKNEHDEDGHQRFLSGTATITPPEGVTVNYAKWSLSGTHLMLVLDITMAPGTELANNDIYAVFNLPSWIVNKLVSPLDEYIDAKNAPIRESGYVLTNYNIRYYVYKDSTDAISIRNLSQSVGDTTQYARVTFDFIID